MRASIQKVQLTGTIIIAVSSILLATLAALPSVYNYLRYRTNAAQLTRFETALQSAWLVSAERGPANNLMGASVPDARLVEGLATARKATDDKLSELERYFTDDIKTQPELAASLAETRQRLRQSRELVDQVVALPPDVRNHGPMSNAISSMFKAADSVNMLRGRAARAIIKVTPDVAIDIALTGTAGVMRDRIGRLGSYVIMSLNANRQEKLGYRAKFDTEMQGLMSLKASLINYTAAYLSTPQLDGALRDLETYYFGQALRYAQNTIVMAQPSAQPSALEFSRNYIAGMRSSDTLRDLILSETRARIEKRKQEALIYGATSLLLAGIAVLVLLRLTSVYKTTLFRPMQSVQAQIAAIAAGDLSGGKHADKVAPEVKKMFQELDFLREQLRQKGEMEKQQRALAEQLRTLSETDALTGVFNRRALEKAVRALLTGDEQYHALGVMIIDIDHFKSINDRHGHAMGDLALQKTANLLRSALRKGDILARYGGEEFVVVLQDVSHATATADRLRRLIEAQTIDEQSGLSLTASFGVVWQEVRAITSWEELIAIADDRLYEAKRAGRNRVWATYFPKAANG
ncbi:MULTISPECIES: GGDEF domain-containing protein [unclassified Agrobacterium]|uniref:GGDEF domain-containing protein n=1 Tax=unclassified Agrobacterium TaxID=2632611 RepID=UPI002449BAA1|nr:MULTISPECIES: GGDEF domain-containing protein [unclassified Agrobacterium]MDH0613753.1 GGDEF domain-containing protein [Agrobacterium sp. GD03872]MDH0696642.1 GGDEF domain-containing protein [Agrobacterium sp. GD03871]MDH1059954.1 GGDEF domain-containing protein [Agrobacterium sp. GD03992]MDH2210107.1 GGDEF domain-containing protein [Agrobacterium sp. GD03643]MDH2219606.1 GGDEF domain-containing protein [Agrobacterium sp. GD03638]